MAVYPKVDKPYISACTSAHIRGFGQRERRRLFAAVGRRLGDALTGLLMLRDLRESEGKLEEAQRIAMSAIGTMTSTPIGFAWSDEPIGSFGLRPQEENITGVV